MFFCVAFIREIIQKTCFSSHLPVLLYKNLTISKMKDIAKNMKNMRSSGYLKEKVVKIENESLCCKTFQSKCKKQISNAFGYAGMFKRLNIEYGKAMCTNSTENIQHYKEAKNSRRGSREIFSKLSCFYRFH
jgi:hypothetical protein